MKHYQELGNVTGTPSTRAVLDVGGSTVDQIFSDAVIAAMPTLVVEQKGIMRGVEVDGQVDIGTVPVFKNFDLSFTDLSGTGSDTGSDLSMSSVSAIDYIQLRPVLRSAGIFVTETALLLTNKASFDEHVERLSVAAQRFMDRTIINNTLLSETALGGESGSRIYAAGGFTIAGSVVTGSTLGPFDLSDAKAILSTGSDVYIPDAVLMHPTQLNQFNQSTDLRNDTYRVSDKATFINGELTSYDNMEIISTELVNGTVGSATTSYVNSGHPVAVFKKKISAAYGRKSTAERIRSWNDIRRHGTYIIVDLMFDQKVLVKNSVILIRAADA